MTDAQISSVEKPIRGRDVVIAAIASLLLSIELSASIAATYIVVSISGQVQKFTPETLLPFLLSRIEQLQANPYFVVLAGFAVSVAIFWVLWRRARSLSPRPLLRFFAPVAETFLWRAGVGGAVLAGLAVSVGLYVAALRPQDGAQLAAMFVVFALFAPLAEEFLFRGYILGWLRDLMPGWTAIGLSAALFALVHGLFLPQIGVSGWLGAADFFALGILTAWWTVRTASLWPAYVAHVVNNGLIVCLSFLLSAL